MITEVGLSARAQVLSVARALDEGGHGVALLDGDGWGGTFLAAWPTDEVRIAIDTPAALDEAARALDRIAANERAAPGWAGRAPAPRWIGYLAYECARDLERPAWTRGGGHDDRPRPIGEAMVLRRFEAIARRDPATGVLAVEGSDTPSGRRLCAALRDASPRIEGAAVPSLAFSAADDDEAHAERIRQALSLIAAGDLYQVNVARRFATRLSANATAVLAGMLGRTNARFGAAIDLGNHALACTSPELFLDVAGRAVRTTPIKGTRPRGLDAESDRLLARELDEDPKERAELTMIVDLERNDLGRIARVGSVRPRGDARIESSRTVHHRVHDVIAELREGATIGDVIRATFPSGSVTGAPKIRAMEVIATLEPSRRGLYCGAILALAPGSSLRAAMAIRTVVLGPPDADGGREAVYHAGGGIVADSDPGREVSETSWKARQVMAR